MIRTVRVRGDLAEARERIRGVLASLDPDLVLYRPRALSSLMAGAGAQDRFATLLMSVFALLALAVAGVGSYGVMAETLSAE